MVEEILFRGFIQSYLFGLSVDKKRVYCIGGICFALMHLPFQMFVHNNVSISYVIQRLPSLFYIVILHLLLCYITSKRKDITIPIAFHFLIDFLQDVL